MSRHLIKRKVQDCIAIIPARGGSKSIPRKNIIDFCGKPLIAWSIEQALRSKHIKAVYVSTDDEEIAKISMRYGAKVIERPASLARDTSSSEDALLHAVAKLEKKIKFDTVIFLQATSPLREDDDLDKALDQFNSQGADSLFSAVKLEDFCVWQINGKRLQSVTYDYKNRSRRQDRQPYYLENGSIYIFRPEVLKKYSNRIGGKAVVYMMDYWKSYQIDDPSDMEICEFFMRRKIMNKRTIVNVKEIDLIAYDFDGVMTNNKVVTFGDGEEAVTVNRADGLAVKILKNRGLPQVIISTEKNKIVRVRANKIGIPVLFNTKNKRKSLIKYCKDNGHSMKRVLFIGNDLNDLEVMKAVGFAVCPADACLEIKEVSRLILSVPGGDGVIRRLIEHIEGL